MFFPIHLLLANKEINADMEAGEEEAPKDVMDAWLGEVVAGETLSLEAASWPIVHMQSVIPKASC
jgi:hypothetical protein